MDLVTILISLSCLVAVLASAAAAAASAARGKGLSKKKVAENTFVLLFMAADGGFYLQACDRESFYKEALRILKKRCGYGSAFAYTQGGGVAVVAKECPLEEVLACREQVERALGIRVFAGIVNSSAVRAKSLKELLELAHFAAKRAAFKDLDFLECGLALEIEKSDADELYRHIGSSLERDEFRPFFLPIIDTSNGRLAGSSAICVWNKDTYREIMPERFYSIAEKRGFLLSVEERFLEKSLDCLKEWIETELVLSDFLMEIALSAKALGRLAEKIPAMLSERGLSPNNLRLSCGQLDEVAAIAKKLSGFSVAADCAPNMVGVAAISSTGCANINGIGEGGALLEKILKGLQGDGISLLVKGIEDKRQFDKARELKLPLTCGTFFTKPLGKENFELFLNKYRGGVPLP